ncbi:MAG TPA: protein kinase, partial [Gemmatimonadaceae bacterium]|nr:protein kinase [Gemmatimonadaceae bacterium]
MRRRGGDPMQRDDTLGPYRIVSKLGEGGMGEVYRARDTRLARDVAIKVLPGTFAADPERVQRFRTEARAAAALNHPNICQIYDVLDGSSLGEEPGPRYLVLEFIEGKPIQGPVPEDQAIDLGLQIATALEAAHRHGVLHRDLKPANILVTPGGTAKILDFGVAKLVGEASAAPSGDDARTGTGIVIGSLGYMSPEQVDGSQPDARSDVFSFGAVLYEMLSGRRAFPGSTPMQTIAAMLTRHPDPLDATPALEAVVRRCLAREPRERFQSAGELVAALTRLRAAAPGAEKRPSIAVLPFENLSGDRDNDYFGDGLAEEIINALARLPGLKVIARTSAFTFKGRHEDMRRVASTLGVANVLEGSVRKAGNRIRITAQLITGTDGSHLWSERYDRDLSDVFAVQDEIAAAIARALEVTLSGDVRDRTRRTPHLAAWEHYLRGQYETQQWTPESGPRARAHFERAIALDPQFPPPYAEFGHLFLMLAMINMMPTREALPLARAQAMRALEIEPGLPEGHAVLGAIAALLEYDWVNAERHFRQALAVAAPSPRVHYFYGHYFLLPTGRLREAVHHHTLAREADPLNVPVRVARSLALRASGQASEADEELQRIMEIDPSFWFPWFTLGAHRALEGRLEEAKRMADEAYRRAPWFAPIVGLRAAVLDRTGAREQAAALVRELERTDERLDPIGPAIFHLIRGDLDATADWTARAIEQRH